ncbi:hypothetical protein BD410DRAFT_781007 [Rickenella mellea]|uniref:DH domain-containing protein n=1 Tax=Rickenella mellea TaxID=50990 RepID=A0A4Y7QLJ4_9AGAM|nr:hypothetical protein BD410DRAFT_781007 [Rickenella mellea]
MLSNESLTHHDQRPLPPIIKEEKLPPPPPPHQSFVAPPALPPKFPDGSDALPTSSAKVETSQSNLTRTGDLSVSSSPAPNSLDLPAPSPTTPSSPSLDGRNKKPNPLVDLIETEKVYVDRLSGVIRKVAAAWSRANLPPAELDTMFRGVEAIYKANRSFLAKLKEIGTAPTSPRPLGDLLMKWINDLETPYSSYFSKFLTGFDSWEPVSSNPRLLTVLATFSASNPPPISPNSSPHPSDPPLWTLDALFLLPRARVKYYQKLYGRLLKNNNQRGGDKMLVEAVDKLSRLMATQEERLSIRPASPSLPEQAPIDEVVIDTRTQDSMQESKAAVPLVSDNEQSRGSVSSSQGSSRSSTDRQGFPVATTSRSNGRESTSTLNAPIANLEQRLATDRCIDLFTMKPRPTRLVMNPPSLPYTRTLRFSTDAVIHFTPRTTGVEIVHQHAHVYLLTDLFLVCERLPSEDRVQGGSDGPDMFLCYPPLAGKHLRVEAADGTDTALMLTILKKEIFFLHVDTKKMRDFMLKEFHACIDQSATLPPPSKQPPPPVPSLNGYNVSPIIPPADAQAISHRKSPSPRSSSPVAIDQANRGVDNRSDAGSTHPRMRSSLDGQMQSKSTSNIPVRQTSTSHNGHTPIPTSTVPDDMRNPPSYNQGQNAFSGMSTGVPVRQPSLPNDMPFGPGSIIPPQRGESVKPIPQLGPLTHSQQEPNRPALPNGMNGFPTRPAFGQPVPQQSPFGLAPASQGFQQARAGSAPPPITPSPPAHFMAGPSNRSTSESSYPSPGAIRKSPSARSLGSQYDHQYLQQPRTAPPMPMYPGGYNNGNLLGPTPQDGRASFMSLQPPFTRPVLPSAAVGPRAVSSFVNPSPPNSPVEDRAPQGPVTSTVCATMKCKVFLQQQHAQWKSLGGAKLTLFDQRPTNVKQLVVEADNRDKTMLISTIVLTDGVERVGKTGVAIELSDKGARTGIVYMIQLRNEKSAGGLFDSLLSGSDRAAVRT